MAVTPFVHSSDKPPAKLQGLPQLVGGKAKGLFELLSMGLPTPRFAVVTRKFFEQVERTALEGGREPEASPELRAARRRRAILDVRFPEDLAAVLADALAAASASGQHAVAVRSSAIDEDGTERSYAGLADSVLNVRAPDFLASVRRVWASVYGAELQAYRVSQGLDPQPSGTAVIVQRMVKADCAGVAFSRHPSSSETAGMVIHSVWGIGDRLISGQIDGDKFILDPRGKLAHQEVVPKWERRTCRPAGGLETVKTVEGRAMAPSLSVKQLRVLFQAVQRLKKAWGGDVDVEFAFEGDAFYVLQCRALTGQRFRHEALHRIWDNSNIVESYSGVTTPLTFSFIKMAYAHVYRQFCELLGVDRRTIQRSRDLFDNMLGFIQGRVYYNLKNWYRLVSLLPAYTYNKEFMERMMGVSQSVTDSAPPASAYKRYFHTLPRLAWVGANIAVTMLTMRARMRRFFERFYRAYSRYSGLRFDSLTIAQLRAKREELERRVLLQWREPILNDLKAMIFVGVLARLTVRWAIDPRGHLQNRLLSGQGSLRSTEVVSQLFAVARRVRASDWSMQLFANQPAEDIMIALKTDPRLAEVAGAIEAYLEKYGVRCQEEMKLESVPMKDNPVQCISVLKHYIQIESGAPRHAPSSGGLLQKLRALGPFRRSVYLWVLRHARQAIRDRENQRFCRSEIYQVVRTLVRALGDRWAARGLLDDREDIFFLGIDEIDAYIDGTSLHSNLKELIAVRRREHERNKREELPSRFETWGEVYPNTAGLAYRPGAPPTAGELEGVPCYPGLAEGTAVVMREFDPGAQLRGEILVARHTDPGWVLLFPSISGLVVERGSVLSHSAILAREMGIPAIVGVPGATQRIRSGDRLRLDGFRGVIQVLSGTSSG